MGYLKVQDANKPQYLVVIIHTEYEQSSYLFVSEASAHLCFHDNAKNGNEVYLTKIMEQNA